MRLPADIEYKITELLGVPNLTYQTARSHRKKLSQLRKQMYELSDDFAQSRFSADRYADAHFAYNFPINFMKAMIVAQRIKLLYPELLHQKDELHILDVGCGEGAAMLGLYYGLKNSKQFVLTGFDQSGTMLKRCREMSSWLKKRDAQMRVKLQRQDVSSGLLPKRAHKYDIVIFANSLAEIFSGETIPVRFIERIFKAIQDEGIIIIIEPALKNLSRRLMNLRDRIIQREKGGILLPCLHEEMCSLQTVREGKEWCHASVSWKPPTFMKILNQGLSREIDHLKFSYLVLSRKTHKRKSPQMFLVISHLLKEKGKKRCLLCTKNGMIELVRLNKHKSQSNKEFDSIAKGNIITVADYILKKPYGWHVVEDSQIKILPG